MNIATAINKYGASLNDNFWVLLFALIPDIIFTFVTKKYNTILLSVKPSLQNEPLKLYSVSELQQNCSLKLYF